MPYRRVRTWPAWWLVPRARSSLLSDGPTWRPGRAMDFLARPSPRVPRNLGVAMPRRGTPPRWGPARCRLTSFPSLTRSRALALWPLSRLQFAAGVQPSKRRKGTASHRNKPTRRHRGDQGRCHFGSIARNIVGGSTATWATSCRWSPTRPARYCCHPWQLLYRPSPVAVPRLSRRPPTTNLVSVPSLRLLVGCSIMGGSLPAPASASRFAQMTRPSRLDTALA